MLLCNKIWKKIKKLWCYTWLQFFFSPCIFTKRKALGLKHRTMQYGWLLAVQLSLENKLLLWDIASISNIAIIQRYQSKILRMITPTPRNISNDQLCKKLSIPTVNREIQNIITNYKIRICNHPNPTMSGLLCHTFSRLKRRTIQNLNLIFRFK